MNNQQLLNTHTSLEEYEADLRSRLSSVKEAKDLVYADILARGGITQMRSSGAISKECAHVFDYATHGRSNAVAPVHGPQGLQTELPKIPTARPSDDLVLFQNASITTHLCQLLERFSRGGVTTRNLAVMLITRQGPYYDMKFEKLRVKVQQALAEMRKQPKVHWRLQWSHKSARKSQEYHYWWKEGNR